MHYLKATRVSFSLGMLLVSVCLYSGCTTQSRIRGGDRKVAEHRVGLIRSDYSPGELTRLCDQAIENATAQLDAIAKIPESERNSKNTLLAFEKINADFSDQVSPLTFMAYVSTDKPISKEGSQCEEKVSQFSVSVFTRKDLYRALQSQRPTQPSEAQLHRETIRDFEENGLKLSDEKLNQVKELKQKLAILESQFSTHLNEDESTAELTAAELAGVPQDYLDNLKKTADGKYIVPTKEPDYVRVMENARSSDARRKMMEAYENRAAALNTKLLSDAIQLRQQIASLMNFKNWADYRMQSRMAKNSETALKFLNGLKGKLLQRSQKDLEKLLTFKKELDPTAKELNAWDIRYLSYQLKKRDFSLDDELVRQYFPADQVVSGMFEVYSKLLGVQYIEDKNAKVWAEGVKLYQIRDVKNGEILAYFYADFFPRTGKYGHAAAFPLISGRVLPDGRYSRPVASIVSNFSAPQAGKPALLKHEEVKTLFHEFGHIMHQTLTRAPYASLSGSSVDQDFVEAPSQMLENWVYSPEILNIISGHYQDRSKKLPSSILQKLIEARDFNQGYGYTRQLLFGLLDMTYHTLNSPIDVTQTYRNLFQELVGIPTLENSHFPASFGHLMGGYDAGYYGYLWSEVYAEDMFTRFEKNGLLCPETGHAYRKTILEKGKMVESIDLVREFLGREPNANAFYKRLHIDQ